jgi:hypothetical protein
MRLGVKVGRVRSCAVWCAPECSQMQRVRARGFIAMAHVCAAMLCRAVPCTGVGGWAESGVNPAEYSRMLMRVACAYIEGADVRAVSLLDRWQICPCASLKM